MFMVFCWSYSWNNTKPSQVKHNEKQDLDKILVSSWQFHNWEREWQVSITYFSNLIGHLKPYPDQGFEQGSIDYFHEKIDCAFI